MILVTGGAGYLGCVLIEQLLKQGKKVRVYDKLYFDSMGLDKFKNKIELVQGDVRDFDERVLDGIQAVAHLGSLSNDPTAEFDPQANTAINYQGTLNLACACKKKRIKKFTFASTCAITGFHPVGFVTEDTEPNPQSEYALSKLKAEQVLQKMADENFCPVILRQATLYGFSSRMRWDLVINTFVKDAFYKGRLNVFHGGDMWRPLVSVQDTALAHILCLQAPEEKVRGEIFHIVFKNFRILELAHRVKEILRPYLPVEVDVVFGATEYRSYSVAGEKIDTVLGFKPSIDIKEAVLEIYQILTKGEYADFNNPKYYNIQWMRLLSEMEKRLEKIGKVL
ncbi:MAG: hypothetical protein DRP78_07260 [Candidatus Omnitrophota bacterium]|nr:MAG: hypothetical protein DRP78_07260 [Candidatus Omnitrophota bacterium]